MRIPPKPFAGIVEAHVNANGSADSTVHTCSPICLKNIPLQTGKNVCGAAVAILSVIAVKAPNMWSKIFLKRKGVLPDSPKMVAVANYAFRLFTKHFDFVAHKGIS